MALDQQRNWDVSMAENLEHVRQRQRDKSGSKKVEHIEQEGSKTNEDQIPARTWTEQPVYLPDEIIIAILDYTSRAKESQKTLASCCLLSRQWYDAAVPLLYAHPDLYGKNFDPFVRTICPSINLHVRPSPLSGLVKTLHLGALVHQTSRSMTARMLSRTKGNLETFVAPQASFASNCLASLSKCFHLRTLDLSLVSESPSLPELFKTVAHLDELRTFRLPRSAGFGVHAKPSEFSWPPRLEELCLSGGIDAHFLHGVVSFPQTLRHLTIEHCPLAKGYAVTHLLKTAVRPLGNLESVTLRHLPRLGTRALDDVLFLLPQIRRLSISVDYVTPAIFDEGHFSHDGKQPLLAIEHWDPHHLTNQPVADIAEESQLLNLSRHPLQYLELTNSGNPGVEDKISPIDVMIAIDEGSLPNLRVVRVAKTLLWHSNSTSADAEALADALQESARRAWYVERGLVAEAANEDDQEDGEDEELAAGSDGKVQKLLEGVDGIGSRPWTKDSGVWMFEG